MLWQCEKSLAEILFDSVLRWWYPGVWPIQVSRGTRATVTTPWTVVNHYCGFPLYFHKASRCVTWSRIGVIKILFHLN